MVTEAAFERVKRERDIAKRDLKTMVFALRELMAYRAKESNPADQHSTEASAGTPGPAQAKDGTEASGSVGLDLSDGDYLRELARLQDENVGPPIVEHTARLRLIADRIDAHQTGKCCGKPEDCWSDNCWQLIQHNLGKRGR